MFLFASNSAHISHVHIPHTYTRSSPPFFDAYVEHHHPYCMPSTQLYARAVSKRTCTIIPRAALRLGLWDAVRPTSWLHVKHQPVGRARLCPAVHAHTQQHNPSENHHVPHASATHHESLFGSLDDVDSLAAPWQPAAAQGRWGLALTSSPHDKDILAYAVPAFFATVLEPVQAMIDTGIGENWGLRGRLILGDAPMGCVLVVL